jgi:hypothetical protein
LGRYFLRLTPPLPASEVEAARALGRRRFNVFLDQIANRLETAKIVERLAHADQGRATPTFDEYIETGHAPADGLAGSFAVGGAKAGVTKMEKKDEE